MAVINRIRQDIEFKYKKADKRHKAKKMAKKSKKINRIK